MTQPVWVIVGKEDTVFTVEDSQAIQRHVPGSRLITVPGANHIIVVNNPEVVERLILDFVRDNAIFAREEPGSRPDGARRQPPGRQPPPKACAVTSLNQRGSWMEQQHDQMVRAALKAVGLSGLQVLADGDDIVALERRPGSTLRFAEALRRGLEAFLDDTRGSPAQGHDSAHHVVRADPESYGLGPGATDAEITEVLRAMIGGDPGARFVLLTPAIAAQPEYRFLPEYGESIEEHWVFRIIIPSAWPILQWSIVDLRGERPAYSYGFD